MDEYEAPQFTGLAEAQLAQVRELALAEIRVRTQLTRAVLDARAARATWEQVGEAAGVSTTNAHQKWRAFEVAQKVGPTGHSRTRDRKGKSKGDFNDPKRNPAPLLHLIKYVVQSVLDGLREPYQEVLPFDEEVVHFNLTKRHLTIECATHQVRVIRRDGQGTFE